MSPGISYCYYSSLGVNQSFGNGFAAPNEPSYRGLLDCCETKILGPRKEDRGLFTFGQPLR
jgi:hypothetical protein